MEHRLLVELEEQYARPSTPIVVIEQIISCAVQEKNMSEQLTQQMKRQAAAHTDHLNHKPTTGAVLALPSARVKTKILYRRNRPEGSDQ